MHHSKITALTFAASSSAAGFPANNVGREEIGRHWRSTSTGASTLDLTWTAAATVAAVLVTDVNFSSCNVHVTTDGSSFGGSIGTLSTFADKFTGRRRGVIAVNLANLKGIRLSISGTPTDGAAYWRVGSEYIFGTSLTLPRDPEMGTSVRSLFAQVSFELPNRKMARAFTGSHVIALSMPFQREYSEDALELVRRATAGTVGIELNNTDYPELVLPVRYYQAEGEEAWTSFRLTETSIELREVT